MDECAKLQDKYVDECDWLMIYMDECDWLMIYMDECA
jgi:hypothetical protein